MKRPAKEPHKRAGEPRPKKRAAPSTGTDWLAQHASKAQLDDAALTALRTWLAEQLVADEHAKLGQGGHTETQVPLRRVFVDLPVSARPTFEVDDAPRRLFLKELLARPPRRLPFDLSAPEATESRTLHFELGTEIEETEKSPDARRAGGILLIGGPGQGKSTLGQLACQLHRAALLAPQASQLPSFVRDVLAPFETKADKDLRIPQEPLFPLRIVLPEASAWLAQRPEQDAAPSALPALLRFVSDLPSGKKAGLTPDILLRLLRTMPFFLLLDGFDEVGAARDRERIVNEARLLLRGVGGPQTRALVVATTRPQGYAGELAGIGIRLDTQYLAPLHTDEALGYAKKLVEAKIQSVDKQQLILDWLDAATKGTTTAPLVRTPLQVNLLTAVAEQQTWSDLGLPHPPPRFAPAQLQRTFMPTEPVVLKQVHVQGLRVLRDVTLPLMEPPTGQGQWTVLIGANGVGKTTLLRSLALALRNLSDPAIWPRGTFATPWATTDGPRETHVRVITGDETAHVTTIRSNGMESFAQTPAHDRPQLFPLFAYGCRRGSAMGGVRRAIDFRDDDGPEVATLFNEEAQLIHAQTWLIGLHSDAVDRPQAKVVLDVVLRALGALLQVDSIEIRAQEVWVTGAGVGNNIRIGMLSDGYLTTAGWFLDLLARWVDLAGRHGFPITEDFPQKMTGLVLIDEIDLHLHPRWQVDVITRARDLLPKMSFVVTTHNPLTLVGAKPEEIWILTLEDGKVRAEQGSETPMLLTGGQIYSRYFGIRDVFPNALGRKLRRYGFLVGYAMRTDEEQRELEMLRDELRGAGIEPGWEEVPREQLPPIKPRGPSKRTKPARSKSP